jgi:hypothetical protein
MNPDGQTYFDRDDLIEDEDRERYLAAMRDERVAHNEIAERLRRVAAAEEAKMAMDEAKTAELRRMLEDDNE